MAEKIGEGYDVVYSDEDKLDAATGELIEPFFKPAWSPEYFRGVMYVGHLLCVRREFAAKTPFDSAFDGVQDFEFMLRLSESGCRFVVGCAVTRCFAYSSQGALSRGQIIKLNRTSN